MSLTSRLDSDSLLKHGVVMIVLGTMVCALGSAMAKPIHEQLGYVLAAMLLGAGLVFALSTMGFRGMRELPRPVAAACTVTGLLMICYAAYSVIQGSPLEMPLVGVLAGLIGLYWAARYMTLAATFKSRSPQAIGLCAVAAANSSLGVILATRTGVSKLGVVTMAGCYVIALGVQVYLSAVALYRGVMRENVLQRQ